MEKLKGTKPLSYTSRSNIGILIIHGFTSTPSSMYPVAEYFVKKKYNVELPLLRGHGTKWQNLNKVSYQDWINDVQRALKKLQKRTDKIFVCGLSMGGLLTLYLAETHPEIKAQILINHALFVEDPRLIILPVLRFFLKSTKAIAADIKDPGADENAYHRTPTNGVYQMVLLQKKVRKYLSLIKQPTLIFRSKEDHRLSSKNATYTFKNISSKKKKIIWLKNSYHAATLDYDKDIICRKSHEFIRQNIH